MKGFKSGRVLKNQSAFLKDWSSLNFLQHCFINIITITMDFFLKLLCSKSALKPTKSKSEINTEVRKCHCMVYNENNHIFYKCRIFFIFWFVRSLGGSAALWGNLRLSCSQDKLILWKIQYKCERSLSPQPCAGTACMPSFGLLWIVSARRPPCKSTGGSILQPACGETAEKQRAQITNRMSSWIQNQERNECCLDAATVWTATGSGMLRKT